MIVPLVLSGPSGVGKTFLERYLENNYPCKKVCQVTTRSKRYGEIEGKDYKFLSIDEFNTIQESGLFLVSGYFFNAHYGLTLPDIEGIIQQGIVPITNVHVKLISDCLLKYPQINTVFLYPTSINLLKKRMEKRGDSDYNICIRLQGAEEELLYYQNTANHFYKKSYEITEENFIEIATDIATNFLLY